MAAKNIDEFRSELITDVQNYQMEGYGLGLRDSFLQLMFGRLEESEQGGLISSFIPETRVGKRKVAADGYRFDEDDGTLVIAICDYSGFPTKSEPFNEKVARRLFNLVEGLVAETTRLGSEEMSTAVRAHPGTDQWDLINLINSIDWETKESRVKRIRFFIISDRVSSDRFMKFEHADIGGFPTELQIWDLSRFYEQARNASVREPLEYEFPEGAVHLSKAAEGNGFVSYLGVIDGNTLADMYRNNGARLLEGNVRSFLSARGTINKGIRRTLRQTPENFFVFNNGIAVTVRNLDLDEDGTLRKATDFQIINGGQTTASIARAKYLDNADISRVAVAMKLTEISPELPEDDAMNLIQSISRYSNNQNKVSEADFFSNHPFHREMEAKSERIAAPAGIMGNTYWFYERSRGKYEQRTMFATAKEARLDQKKFPKNQVIKKEDLARVRLCWSDSPKPHIVSKGAAALFKDFSEEVSKKWENKDKTGEFGDDYYRDTVSLIIMRMQLRAHIGGGRDIAPAPWYGHGYLANIVDYSMAVLAYFVSKEWEGVKYFNLREIWNRQTLPDELLSLLMNIAERVQSVITSDGRGQGNVTQWCKQVGCWQAVKDEFTDEDFLQPIENLRLTKDAVKASVKENRASNKMESEVDLLTKVLSFKHWADAFDFDMKNNVLGEPSKKSAIKAMTKLPSYLPPNKVCSIALKALEELRDEGFEY
jgi:hypothetical protein